MRQTRKAIWTLGAIASPTNKQGEVVLLGVDWLEGLPLWWCFAEGPINIGFGIAILALARRVGDEP